MSRPVRKAAGVQPGDMGAGRPIVDAVGEFNSLIARAAYDPAVKTRLIQLLVQLDVCRETNGVVPRNRTPHPQCEWLRANRGTARR